MSPPKPRPASGARPAARKAATPRGGTAAHGITPVRGGAQAKAPAATLRLRVTLFNVQQPVWREVRVPGELTFAHLHAVVQAAMGWEDCHMHEFRIGKDSVGMPSPGAFFQDDRPLLDERKTRLRDLLGRRPKFRYWYDFGDDWWHEIAVVRDADHDGGQGLLAGEGACPPEDCGGPYGYAEMLLTLADPKDPQYEETREWAGDVDPTRFDFDAAARAVAKVIKRMSARKQA